MLSKEKWKFFQKNQEDGIFWFLEIWVFDHEGGMVAFGLCSDLQLQMPHQFQKVNEWEPWRAGSQHKSCHSLGLSSWTKNNRQCIWLEEKAKLFWLAFWNRLWKLVSSFQVESTTSSIEENGNWMDIVFVKKVRSFKTYRRRVGGAARPPMNISYFIYCQWSMVEEFVEIEEWIWKYFKAFIIATNSEMDDLIGWDAI